MSNIPRLLTAAEAAEVLRMTPSEIVRRCKSGAIPASKPGRQWLIRTDDLDAYIAAHSNQKAAS